MASREFRNVPGSLLEVRVSADGRSGRVIADVMKYNTVDDYRTTFDPGCFSDSLEQRMPRILWAHNPVDPIGQWTDAEDTRDRLRLAGLLDLQMIPGTQTPAVPSAHRAWAQMESRTIDQFSVGFLRQAEDRNRHKGSGVVAITKALLDEASPVLIGSVPGAQLVSVRSSAVVAEREGSRLYFFPSREKRDGMSSANAGMMTPTAAATGGKFKSGGGRHPAAPRPSGPAHAGGGTKSKADKLAAAKAKYGEGSPQHRAALKRWG